MTRATRPVVLTGPPASGKSAVAPVLAARLGTAWSDTDDEVVRASGGRAVHEIFRDEGEEGFRERERDALAALLARPGVGVIATGGGTLLDPRVRRALLREAWVLALDAPLATLVSRAGRARTPRPLLGRDPSAAIARLLARRADVYAEVHDRVSNDGAVDETVGRLVSCVDALESHPTLVVPLGARTHRVHVAPIATLDAHVRSLAPSSVIAVTDRRVAALPSVRPVLDAVAQRAMVELDGEGDRDKTLASLVRVWDAALRAAVDRGALVLGVGGGVVTDLAGFAAATLLRGVRCATAPTTLLAMADASVGGKTGIDHAAGKNLLGAFHQPSVVVCDPSLVRTQSVRDRRAGLAEIVKIALVRSPALLATIEHDAIRLRECDPDALAEIIAPAIQAKIDVVAEDELEGGLREVLNFGHTFGHAIESAAEYRLPHGECVAIGMRGALALGLAAGITPRAFVERAVSLLDALAMPLRAEGAISPADAMTALGADKKRRGGALRFVLATGDGAAVVSEVERGAAERALCDLLEIRVR